MDSRFKKENRAVIILTAYDSISLYLTLKGLNHTLDQEEKVVIILNGNRGIRSSRVEEVARSWSANNLNRFVVRPLNYGKDPYKSINEILNNFEPLNNVEYICKIDDDLVPLRKNWLDALNYEYEYRSKTDEVGFVTALINNNTWGFAELLDIFDKKEEYSNIMNYKSESGEGLVLAGDIANGVNGTIWQYPYLARWCHQWTTLDISNYIDKTKYLSPKIIPSKTHYSIGCIFFKKELWGRLESINNSTDFDELSLHLYCKSNNLIKVAVMNQPMVHLFYFVQRKANASMLPMFAESFAVFWNDNSFIEYPKLDLDTQIMMQLEDLSDSSVFQNFNTNHSLFRKITKHIRNSYLQIKKSRNI